MSIWQRLHNEWPTILAGLAALANALGVATPEEAAEVGNVAESVLAFLVWLHVRRSVDGPVTRKADGDG